MSIRFSRSHEWADDETMRIGISDYAQDSLGEIVYVELPEIDQQVQQGERVGVVESVKAASDLYAPIGGTVVEVNNELERTPALLNSAPEKRGVGLQTETGCRRWLGRIDGSGRLSTLYPRAEGG